MHVVDIAFADRTSEGLLRHATYRGLREDKLPSTERSTSRSPSSRNPQRSKAGSTSPLADEHLAMLAGVRMTHPERVIYLDVGLTKLDLASYHVAIADWILPEIVDRPLALLRCPDGTGGDCFFQKHADRATPEAVEWVTALLLPLRDDGVLDTFPIWNR